MRQLTDNLKIIEFAEFDHLRDLMFQEYARRYFSGENNIISITFCDEMIKHINTGNKYAEVCAVKNLKDSIANHVKGNYGPLELAFSMITIYKDEKQTDRSEEFHNDKIKNILLEGITTDSLRGEVLNFIIQHPESYPLLTEAVVAWREIFYSDSSPDTILE